MSKVQENYGPASSEALFRNSASDGWLNCYGRTNLCKGLTGSSSGEAARRGTAIHFMAEKALKNEFEPIEWVDRVIKVEGYDIVVTDDMADSADMYVNYVRGLEASGAEIQIEARLTLQPLDPNDPLLGESRGSADVVALWRKEKIIEIVDLKSGSGYMVPANSKPTRLYGLQAMVCNSGVDWQEIRTTIVQPPDPDESARIRTHRYTPDEMWEFVGTVYEAMATAMQPDAPLTPGEEQCQWCPAKGKCPALAQMTLDVARSAFTAVPLHAASPMPAPGDTPTLPDPSGATDEEISVWLERRTLVEEWFKGIEQVAARRLTVGRKIAGWKMVKRTGNRKWIDPENVPLSLRALGVQTSAMYAPPKLISPAAIERVLPKDKHAALANLYDRADNGLALVPDTNKKPAAAGIFGPAPGYLEKP